MKKYKVKFVVFLVLIASLLVGFSSCDLIKDKIDDVTETVTTKVKDGLAKTLGFSDTLKGLGDGLLGKFKGSEGGDSFFKILSAKVVSRGGEATEEKTAILVDNGITYELDTYFLEGKDGKAGKLVASGYSEDGNKKVVVTANVPEEDKFTDVKVKMSIRDDDKWITKKINAEIDKEQTGASYGTPVKWAEESVLPSTMQGIWEMALPSDENMSMDMYFKYIPEETDSEGNVIPAMLEPVMPGMGGGPGGDPNGPGGPGPGGPGPGGPGPGGPGPGGPGPGGQMPVPEDAQFKFSMEITGDIRYIISGSTLEPVLMAPENPKLEVVKDKDGNDIQLPTGVTLEKAQALFDEMNPEPENEKIKPMDILFIKKIDDVTYDIVIAQTMEAPPAPQKPDDDAPEEEKEAYEEEMKFYNDMIKLPPELEKYSEDGFSLTAYDKMRLKLTKDALLMTPYQLMKAPESGQEPNQNPSEEEMNNQMNKMFDYEFVKDMGEDHLIKDEMGGMKFKPVK